MTVRRLPRSVIRPTPCWAIAARTSGASAMRSTSIWAFGPARSSAHTRSASSVSSALTTASATSSLVSACWSARSRALRSSSTRTIARSTAGLRRALTIASSVASSIALSTPVAPASRSAPRALAPSTRAAAERDRGSRSSRPLRRSTPHESDCTPAELVKRRGLRLHGPEVAGEEDQRLVPLRRDAALEDIRWRAADASRTELREHPSSVPHRGRGSAARRPRDSRVPPPSPSRAADHEDRRRDSR